MRHVTILISRRSVLIHYSSRLSHLSVVVDVECGAGVGGLYRHLGEETPGAEPVAGHEGGQGVQAGAGGVDGLVLAPDTGPRQPGLQLQPDDLLLLVLPDRVLLRHLAITRLGSAEI